jgi:hypothetical protein
MFITAVIHNWAERLAAFSLLSYVFGALSLLFLSHLLSNFFQPGLVDVPGPYAAKFTNLWRLFKVWQMSFKEDLPGLHAMHRSTLIRIGPRMVSCSDPRAVELIYGFHTEFNKVSFYARCHQSPSPADSHSLIWSRPWHPCTKERNSPLCSPPPTTRLMRGFVSPSRVRMLCPALCRCVRFSLRYDGHGADS